MNINKKPIKISTHNLKRFSPSANIKKQKGVAMIIALLALAGMMIAAASLIRAADTTNSVAGNIASRNATAQSNDWAILQAQNWLLATRPSGGLNNSNASMGYYSSSPSAPVDWTIPDSWLVARNLGTDTTGNTQYIVIQRLCTQGEITYNGTNGSGVINLCALRYPTSDVAAGNSTGFGSFQYDLEPQIFYRVVARSVGPKGTTAISMSTIAVAS